jgi:hypothetical protein
MCREWGRRCIDWNRHGSMLLKNIVEHKFNFWFLLQYKLVLSFAIERIFIFLFANITKAKEPQSNYNTNAIDL